MQVEKNRNQTPDLNIPANAHALKTDRLIELLGVDLDSGLDAAEVSRRFDTYGANELEKIQTRSAWLILIGQLRGIVIYILIVAAVLSFLFGEWKDGIAISLVLVINTLIGFVSELRAVRSMESLRKLDTINAVAIRSATPVRLAANVLVPGDIILLETGDLVPADVRVLEQQNLQCDESVLTGESVPVSKSIQALDAKTVLAERFNMAFRGCTVSSGKARCVVTATGSQTQIGRIAKLTMLASPETSPLEKRLDTLGQRLVWLTVILACVIGGGGVLAGQDWLEMARIAVTLSVAAVPEGLPVVATVALARGMWRMARQNALINQLSAVETLGAMTMVMTDKTGTLTENRMALTSMVLPDGEISLCSKVSGNSEPAAISDESALAYALTIASLCNETDSSGAEDTRGDPMELALINAARDRGFNRMTLLDKQTEMLRVPFERKSMLMATVHETPKGLTMYVKGAPEAVLARCSAVLDNNASVPMDEKALKHWQQLNVSLSFQGLRVLALAMRDLRSVNDGIEDLVFVGLACLMDPARKGVSEAIRICRDAGIRVVMITGDQAGTASKIARDVGITDSSVRAFESNNNMALNELDDEELEKITSADVIARVTPERKLELVELYQRKGHIVGMLGDGVNDAPALKKADIGIAMGQRGTDVAQDASAVILLDDEFMSVTAAVMQGRVIFDNIRSFVVYLLSCNLSEILLIGGAVLMGLPLPLLPIHILFLNFVTDVFPAFALGFGDGNKEEMQKPPRDPLEPVVSRNHWIGIVLFGLLIAASVLVAYLIASSVLGFSQSESVTVSFIALSFAQLWHVFNIRLSSAGLLDSPVTRNPLIWMAVTGCMVLVVVAVFTPGLSGFLHLDNPGLTGWLIAVAAAWVPLVLGQFALHTVGLSILDGDNEAGVSRSMFAN